MELINLKKKKVFFFFCIFANKMEIMKVLELFAGVGGFRIGLDRVNDEYKNHFFDTIWSNQYEPATKRQYASEVYIARFGADGHVNKDISLVPTIEIPDAEMLCGGIPCQDYSVASTLSKSSGIYGKKGVLWWQIERICREKRDKAPKLLLLENVDRLLQSPASQRGRDFSMILQSLADLNYVVEWRIINAADYGMPQRRRRTYVLAYKEDTSIASTIKDAEDWILFDGVFAKAFPVSYKENQGGVNTFLIKDNANWNLVDLSKFFNAKNNHHPFSNAGIMKNGKVWTTNVESSYDGHSSLLGDILAKGKNREQITEDFYIHDADLNKWKYLKGAKKEPRVAKNGHQFYYSEGSMVFPDPLDKPSRTIITSEGGSGPSRFKHVILDPENHRLRRLIPLELERLDMFPDNHTLGQTDQKRAFFMGNALVCGIITRIGEELYKRLH